MADAKISALTNLTAADPTNDMIPIVDVSDTPPASGNTKRISINNILSSSPTASGALTVTGLVTAGSATITGDLTVDTSTLKVDSTNNRVGIGTASPAEKLTIDNTLGGAAIALRVFANDQSTARIGVQNTNGQAWHLVAGYAGANNQGLSIFDATTGANRLYLDTSGNANIINGNLVIGTSGKGIDFSATASGSGTMTSELLNDYEEGTWVGTLTGSTTNPTVPVTATGRYTKIGRVVTVQIFYSNVSTVGASGNIGITGLPFANNGSTQSVGSVSLYQIGTFTGSTFAIIDNYNSSIEFNSNISGSVYGNVTHNAGIARYMTTSITYTVA